jgi:hypothetical protein
MKAADVPQELKDMLDASAGKAHSREGAVMQALAAILARWEEIHAGSAYAEQRYRNCLLWIRHIAALHYFGGAFNPEHMRTLANLAADTLGGKDLPDYEERMTEAQQRAREMADALGIELAGDDDSEPG